MYDYGTLTDYQTGQPVRPATPKEWLNTAVKLNSGESDACTGAWNDDDGQAVYVDGGPDAEVSDEDIRLLRDAAGRADDSEQVRLCSIALGEGDEDDEHWTPRDGARIECAQVILNARMKSVTAARIRELPYAACLPQRSTCHWCQKPIERTSSAGDWTSAKLAGVRGRDRECPQAPNPADGPMPGHEPGTAIVSAPAEENA